MSSGNVEGRLKRSSNNGRKQRKQSQRRAKETASKMEPLMKLQLRKQTLIQEYIQADLLRCAFSFGRKHISTIFGYLKRAWSTLEGMAGHGVPDQNLSNHIGHCLDHNSRSASAFILVQRFCNGCHFLDSK